ncbi:MAG: ATP-binding protein [Prosthecobacter sp.]|uniref:ATP-binding protein n=1 Tax=Prosthecobacter sp. TaxID=1965333 RepID=UPI00260C566C|nr:ATP-binding protein [Prosthecobacter sp.]MCF7788751.1 ATP-binding protein [Prosthecobacter sp.]
MPKEFKLKILGRTIEHLGTQMYKHRAPSIAELVANCHDAGAKNVWIDIPEEPEYDRNSSIISVRDDGEGMTSDSVQLQYLVIGRNRRAEDKGMSHGRKVMGRKGIGKLAGFGLASKMTLTTWTENIPSAIRFSMSLEQLKCNPGAVEDITFPWDDAPKIQGWPSSGTMIHLSGLKHASPLQISALAETLARRFSRTTRGEMVIHINGTPVTDPDLETVLQHPEDGSFEEETLPSGNVVKYRYSFSKATIKSAEMQGFAIYAHERTAQAPPFFFNVESTASGQHSTRYVTGEIKADYLDDGIDDESDLTSTDRQELDWEKEEVLRGLSCD